MKTVKPLTASERAWVDALRKLMNSCPSKRLGAYTTGDANITFFDKPVFDAGRRELERQQRDLPEDVQIHESLGTVLESVSLPFQLEGVAG